MDDNNFDQIAHNIAEEIYEHIENDHVKDDFLTWIDLALLACALITMTIIPVIAAPMTLLPNVGVKGYQVACRYKRHRNGKAGK